VKRERCGTRSVVADRVNEQRHGASLVMSML